MRTQVYASVVALSSVLVLTIFAPTAHAGPVNLRLDAVDALGRSARVEIEYNTDALPTHLQEQQLPDLGIAEFQMLGLSFQSSRTTITIDNQTATVASNEHGHGSPFYEFVVFDATTAGFRDVFHLQILSNRSDIDGVSALMLDLLDGDPGVLDTYLRLPTPDEISSNLELFGIRQLAFDVRIDGEPISFRGTVMSATAGPVVPEPGTLGMAAVGLAAGLGLAGVGAISRSRGGR